MFVVPLFVRAVCHFPFIIPLLIFLNVSANQLSCFFFFREALSSMALFDLGLSFIIFAGFACCHYCFIGNVLSLKKEYLKFLFLGLIFAGSSSSCAQALCACQRHIAVSSFVNKAKKTKCSLSPILMPPIVPSYTYLLGFLHPSPKLGFLDAFFILWHSFHHHDFCNSFTFY